jgi:D-aminopeptidase
MTAIDKSRLETAVRSLPSLYRGPGGVVAVVKEGEVLVRHAWGYADVEHRVPMSAATLMPICSISKQFTCATLLESVGDPAVLDAALEAYLPDIEGKRPTVADLCNNQSGLRDYWALTVLCGAAPEGKFRPADAQNLLKRARTTHFAPGTHYSYANGNFRILSDLIESHTGRPLGDLIAEHVLKPAGMKTAQFCADTSAFPGDAIGYDGNTIVGFEPAINRIHWSGDAGICASLDDMIAWEQFIDATRDEPDGLYNRISVPPSFVDGSPARYGLGLAHMRIGGIPMTGHGGAIRGWRSQRVHAPSERLSVVVMFNHQESAHPGAEKVMLAALGQDEHTAPSLPDETAWAGHYLDDETKLTLSLTPAGTGRLTARFATSPEIVAIAEDGAARSDGMVLTRTEGGIALERAGENLRLQLRLLAGEALVDIEGRFHCAELDADFLCTSAGGALYGAFEGFLGKSPMQPLYPVGPDVWLLPCQRAMDAPAPGDWSLVFDRDDKNAIAGVTIGCWLARGLTYRKI